ncbi:MAG: helix-turn-helix transcriptional regulator [Actinomycetota bacterium]|nr:helix-turn-helix transcriptional regulator [Actinomycetota bacterium]
MARTTSQLDPEAVGERIKQLRLGRGLSQEALAVPRYTAAYISHLEKGKRTASEEALEHIARRLDVPTDQLITGRDPKRDLQLQLDVDRALAQSHSGEIAPLAEELDRLRKRARRQRLPRLEAAAHEGLGLLAKRTADWTQAREHFVAAEELLADEPPEVRTSVVTGRAWTYFMMNDLAASIRLLELHLIELCKGDAPDPSALLQTYSYLIGPCFEAGLKKRAAEAADEAARLETRVQDPEHVACMNINRAQILLEQGRRDEAIRALGRAEELFKQIGWRDSAAKAAVAQATAAVEEDDLEAAEARAKHALSELEVSPSALDKARVLNLLGRIQRKRGHPDRALGHLNEALALLEASDSMERAWALREAGLCHLDLNDPEAAEPLLRQALTMYTKGKARDAIATASAYLGDALMELGRHQEAASIYRSGLAKVEDLAV